MLGDLSEPWAWAEAAYPEEACGLGVGAPARWVRIENVAEEPRRAFTFDPAAHLQALLAADRAGAAISVVFHSHCDAPPDLSARDIAGALVDGEEVYAGALHLVLSVRGGRRHSWAAFRYDPAEEGFREVARAEARTP